jgi:hypothetical protein
MQWLKGLPKWAKWSLGIFVLLIAISALAGGEEGSDQSDKASEKEAQSSGAGSEEGSDEEGGTGASEACGTTATDDCTPHVGPTEKVKVDALLWQIESVRTTPTIGEQTYGLGEKANGIYIVANLEVTSTKDESATLSDDVVTLVVDGGNTYNTDSDGTFAAMGEGQEPFFLTDIGPDSTISGPVVFDVPPSVLGKKLELSFGELGFGSTKGFIRLPSL